MLLYKLLLICYPRIAKIWGFFNMKAKQWSEGQAQVWEEIYALKQKINAPVIWVHAASYGEFEQGLPIIEKLKETYPNYQIWLTFFSPSGYLHRKTDASVDFVTYMPFDCFENANRFLNLIQPKLILFIKYEFWYHYLDQANKKNIPVILVSALFRKNQLFFKWYGRFYRKMINKFDYVLVQEMTSYELIKPIIDPSKLYLTGDTRFDRVSQTAQTLIDFPWMKPIQSKPVLIAGSTWDSDHALIAQTITYTPSLNWIIVPHHVDEKSIEKCKSYFNNSITLSQLERQEANLHPQAQNVLIIDRIGMLRRLYQVATLCYVGGGFTKDGIHNVLEPAAFSKPVIWGSNDYKYREAIGLLEAGGGKKIEDSKSLIYAILNLLNNKEVYEKMANSAGNYIATHIGATDKTIQLIQEKRLLTN